MLYFKVHVIGGVMKCDDGLLSEYNYEVNIIWMEVFDQMSVTKIRFVSFLNCSKIKFSSFVLSFSKIIIHRIYMYIYPVL